MTNRSRTELYLKLKHVKGELQPNSSDRVSFFMYHSSSSSPQPKPKKPPATRRSTRSTGSTSQSQKQYVVYDLLLPSGRLNFSWLQKISGGIRSTSIRGRKYPSDGSGNYSTYSEEKRSEVNSTFVFRFGSSNYVLETPKF